MKLPTKEILQQMNKFVIKKSKKATPTEKALMVLDEILSKCEDIDKTKSLSHLYRIVHGSNIFNTCYNAHSTWRKETEEEFNKIIEEIKLRV